MSSETKRASHKSPGKAYRHGITVMQMSEMFATEQHAIDWFESLHWPEGEIACLRCGSLDAYRVKNGRPMPYRCRDCKKYFSLKTGTVMEDSKLPLRLWAWAIYLELTSLKGVSSMKLRRDLGVRQATAWFMLHRIRAAFADMVPEFEGVIEVDETYVGGLDKNKHHDKKLGRDHWKAKTAVIGAKDRATGAVTARVIDRTDSETLQSFVEEMRVPGEMVYTDGNRAYDGLEDHDRVYHSVGEYVRDQVHTNGVESFWSMLKRAHKGVYHRLSAKHLQAYVDTFCGRHNMREMDTIDQMRLVAAAMVGKRLLYKDLVAGPKGYAS